MPALHIVNGNSETRNSNINKLSKAQAISEVANGGLQNTSAKPLDVRTVQTIRGLVLDCCQQWGIGHGGSALGMAAIATALWKHRLRYAPNKPEWLDRDRFVMSNGHVAILQYIMLHLAGFKDWTMEQLKAYGHPTALDFTNMTKTHPEIEFPGLDIGTGPLGQGVANAVGMAIVNMNLRATFNRDGFEVVKGVVYCTLGDACLQEGVALEAISLAGHLKLDNLILIYDNNGIQCDGPITLTFHEDVNAKMRACGFYVLEILDGNSNVRAIESALKHAHDHVGQPVFINITTVIGIGTSIAGTCKAHHTAFGEADIRTCKELWGFEYDKTHFIPSDVQEYWSGIPQTGDNLVSEWENLLTQYENKYPELAKEFRRKIDGDFGAEWKQSLLQFQTPRENIPTRQASAQVYDALWNVLPLIGGSADLSEPNFMLRKAKKAFGPAQKGVLNAAFDGRYVHYGVREHGMMAIANGMAAYSPQAYLPITATFAMFQLYGAAAIRMSALNRLQIIHIGTHDSIAEGACGPTHQPVELINLFRATPLINHIRPADAEEVVGAWIMALDYHGPSVIGLNRHSVPLLAGSSRYKTMRGAYVLTEDSTANLTLISTGGDVFRAVEAAKILQERGTPTRVVSMPSMRRFEEQDESYIRSVLPWDGRPIVSFEAMSTHGWARWSTASIGHNQFGTTVQADAVFPHFRLTAQDIAQRVQVYLTKLGGRNAFTVPWQNI